MAREMVEVGDYPPEETRCLRCGEPVPLRFSGPCEACTAALHERFTGEPRVIEGDEYVPKSNVTPNAVALRGD